MNLNYCNTDKYCISYSQIKYLLVYSSIDISAQLYKPIINTKSAESETQETSFIL